MRSLFVCGDVARGAVAAGDAFEVLEAGLRCFYCDWLIKNDIASHII